MFSEQTIGRDAMINDPKFKTKFRIIAAVKEMEANGEPITIRGVAKKVKLTAHSNVRAHMLALSADGLINWKREYGGKIAA
jgi:hypothetical protein